MEPVLLYITAASREEAISLSRELLNERLVACTNIMEHVTAMYHWQGEIEHAPEVVVIAKTLASHIERVTRRVKELHSYSNPCVLAVPVIGGSPEYIAWLKEETEERNPAR
jgi:periplasmic divalent cation tolerance protein